MRRWGSAIDYLLAASFMAAPGGILMAKIIMPDAKRSRRGRAIGCPRRGSAAGTGAAAEGDVRRAVARRDARRGKARQPHHGGGAGRADRRQARGRGRRDGAGVRRAGGAGQRPRSAGVGGWFGYPDLSFQEILGTVFAPVMFLLNVPWNEAGAAGGLFGTKIVLNEFVAFIDLGKMQAAARRAPSRSSPSRCAASPISRRSRSRWR